MLARMNFAAQLANNQKFNLLSSAKQYGGTPEALLSFYLDELRTAPLDNDVRGELMIYLRATGTWTGTDAQVQAKSAGLVHLIAGLPEYQLI
jgi:hypothetical protein